MLTMDVIKRGDLHATPLDNLLANQKFTYEKIYLNPQNKDTFDTPTFHYDWWLFPVEAPRGQWSQTADYYSIDSEVTEKLLKNPEFILRYLECIRLYLAAQNRRWNDYGVRLGKIMLSLTHFMKHTLGREEYTDYLKNFRQFSQDCLNVAYKYQIPKDGFHYNAIYAMEHYLRETEDTFKKQLQQHDDQLVTLQTAHMTLVGKQEAPDKTFLPQASTRATPEKKEEGSQNQQSFSARILSYFKNQ